MNALTMLFDLVLCGTLLWLSWRAVTLPGLFHSVILFMVFGFLMALTWARLGAVDLALAEAAIGAGVMGALMLNACRAALVDSRSESETPTKSESIVPHRLVAVICVTLGVLMAIAMTWLAVDQVPPNNALHEALAAHPLDNPVSAVLLDFRGYDTLLEMAVLMAAFLGTRSLATHHSLPNLHPAPPASSQMVDSLTAMVTPILLTMALYLYWVGADTPGGAFQAGALLGALGVMYLLTGRIEPRKRAVLPVRIGLVAGLAVFAIFACLGLVWSGLPMAYPSTGMKGLALLVELSLMTSIAVTLTLLLSASPGLGLGRRR